MVNRQQPGCGYSTYIQRRQHLHADGCRYISFTLFSVIFLLKWIYFLFCNVKGIFSQKKFLLLFIITETVQQSFNSVSAFTKYGCPIMTYQRFYKTLKQQEQAMAKTHNYPDNQSTTSDTSTGSNRMKTCSQDEEEFDGSIGDTEQETDTIKYFL